MKRASVYQIAVTAMGCVLGAGLLSGQELLQFFGVFGIKGFWGIGFAVAIFYVTCCVIIGFARDAALDTMERMVIFFNSKISRALIAGFEMLFLFLIYVLMAAAAGALVAQMLSAAPAWGCGAFCLLVAVVSLCGISGLVRIFAYLVPMVTLATVALCLYALCTGNMVTEPMEMAEQGNWALSALLYVIFNVICSVPILAPLGKGVKKGGVVRCGMLVAALSLGVVATLVLATLLAYPESWTGELPMLALAASIGEAVYLLYALLLFGAMFGTGLSSGAAILTLCRTRFSCPRCLLPIVSFGVAACVFGVAQSGFRELVGVLYPVFGYIGMVPLALLFIHAFLFYRARKKRGEK